MPSHLSRGTSGAIRRFAGWLARGSVGHPMLEGINYWEELRVRRHRRRPDVSPTAGQVKYCTLPHAPWMPRNSVVRGHGQHTESMLLPPPISRNWALCCAPGPTTGAAATTTGAASPPHSRIPRTGPPTSGGLKCYLILEDGGEAIGGRGGTEVERVGLVAVDQGGPDQRCRSGEATAGRRGLIADSAERSHHAPGIDRLPLDRSGHCQSRTDRSCPHHRPRQASDLLGSPAGWRPVRACG
ncbi:hypothetical protein C3488_28890 [Streptomyces sp. Ru72]|nr:hypothetical protein C3488_28890 [Streptomyces sp. Ru72]